MNFFLRHLNANRFGFAIILIMQGFLFLFGVLIVFIINTFINDEQDYALIGSMMALMASAFGGLLRGSGGMNRYRTAVSMGHTRRAYMLADPLVTALFCTMGLASAWVLSKFELWLYHTLYPGWEMEFDIVGIMKWWHFLVFIVVVCAFDYFMGALQLRFGTKGFMVIWLPLCFSGVIINSTVGAAQEGSTSLLAQLGRGILYVVGLLRPAMWAGLGILVLLVLLICSTMWYRKAEIKI